MSSPRRRRWMEMLRRTTGVASEGGARAALEDAALWDAHRDASRSVEESNTLAESVAATLTRQRAIVDATSERASLVYARSEGLGIAASRVTESFERLGVVALNAGLEGARVPEAQGRALSLLSEEIRANVVRGAEAAAELREVVDELMAGTSDVRRQVDGLRTDLGAVGQEAMRLKASSQHAAHALDDLSTRLHKATGVDPEVARAVSEASEHVKGLMNALSAVPSAQAAAATRALGPVVVQLMRLLQELVSETAESGEPSPPPSRGRGSRGGASEG